MRYALLAFAAFAALLQSFPVFAQDSDASSGEPADTWDRSYQAVYHDASIRLTVGRPRNRFDPDFIIIQRPEGASRSVRLPGQIGEVSDIEKVGFGEFAIFQSGPAPYAEVSILDADSETFRDDITCYSPSLSPDHHYLAFTKFYPPHGEHSPLDDSDFALLYDFSLPPNTNLDPRRDDQNSDISGFLLFPKNWKLEPSVSPIKGIAVYSFASNYMWAPDSSKMIFLTISNHVDSSTGQEFSDSASSFVMVSFQNQIRKTYVLKEDVCGSGPLHACAPTMTSAKFSANAVTVTLTGTSRGQVTQTLPFNSFEPL